jgi:hypothetical protein
MKAMKENVTKVSTKNGENLKRSEELFQFAGRVQAFALRALDLSDGAILDDHGHVAEAQAPQCFFDLPHDIARARAFLRRIRRPIRHRSAPCPVQIE